MVILKRRKTVKPIPFWKKLGFDSEQEFQINEWLKELKNHGLVGEINYQPSSIRLNDELIIHIPVEGKIKPKKQVILKKHDYTPDFEITAKNSLFEPVMEHLGKVFKSDKSTIILEVKPDTHDLKLQDSHGSTRLFTSRTQPCVYEKFGIFVNLVTPNILFSSTFVPTSLMDDFYYKKTFKHKGVLIHQGQSKVPFMVQDINEFIKTL